MNRPKSMVTQEAGWVIKHKDTDAGKELVEGRRDCRVRQGRDEGNQNALSTFLHAQSYQRTNLIKVTSFKKYVLIYVYIHMHVYIHTLIYNICMYMLCI